MTDNLKDCRQRPVFIHSRLDDIPLSMEAFRVYCHLARRANECSQAWPSYRSIGEKCFRGSYPDSKTESLRRKAINAVKELISWNLLSVESRSAANGSHTSNLYCLTDDSVWYKAATNPNPNARKGRERQPSDSGVVMGEHYPSDRGTLGGVVMGEHYPSDRGTLGSDGGTPKVYPYEVNPIEVTPHTKERAREELEIQVAKSRNSDRVKDSNQDGKAGKKPAKKLSSKQTNVPQPSLSSDESIIDEGDTRTPLPSHQTDSGSKESEYPQKQGNRYDRDDRGFLDYLVSTYLPTVGKWRDLSVRPTAGDAKNWIALREKDGNLAQVQNKWDDYQQQDLKPQPPPYIPPTPRPDVPVTEKTIAAKAEARAILESFLGKNSPLTT